MKDLINKFHAAVAISVFIIVASLVAGSLSPISGWSLLGIFIVEFIGALAYCSVVGIDIEAEFEKEVAKATK